MFVGFLSTGLVGLGLFLLTMTDPVGAVGNVKEDETNVRGIVAGNTNFAIDLYHRLRTEDGNLFLSPHSISTALAMTYAGARGETASQISDVLYFPRDQASAHQGFETLEQALTSANSERGYELRVANGLWGQNGEPIRDAFIKLIGEHYGGQFTTLDFQHAAEKSREQINRWVADHTDQKIVELLHKDDVTRDTVLVLTNAMYFKGAWLSQFDPSRTVEGAFNVSASQSVTVNMMHKLGQFAHTSVTDANVLELPFKGDRLSMVIVLPKRPHRLADVEQSLSRDRLDAWIEALRDQPVRVTLPRFSLECRFDLAKTLSAMGMRNAFRGGADFSGISEVGGLFISKAFHQARVDVNEKGAEASAAIAVIMTRSPTAIFNADHPFLFIIRDNQTASVLFMGRVTDPTK